MEVTTSRGARIAVHDLGGSGDPVLICHATGFCGRAYASLGRVLAGRFHVWALDFAGHGDSGLPPDEDFSLQGMALDLAGVTRAIAAGPLALVVGHSVGGAVALKAAAEDPTLFAAAYVYEPAITPTDSRVEPGSSNYMSDIARRRRSTFASKEAVFWRYASKPPLGDLEAASLAAYVEHGFRELPDGTVTLKCLPESEARTFESSGGAEDRRGIRVVDTAAAVLPTLCVTGDDHTANLPALVPPVVAAMPNAQLRVHANLGHFGPLQRPELIGREAVDHALGVAGAATAT